MRNMFSELICDACRKHDESQKHVIECVELNEKDDNKLEYENLYKGSVSEKVKIAQKFEENHRKLHDFRVK